MGQHTKNLPRSRLARGVWVEISLDSIRRGAIESRLARGVWVEISYDGGDSEQAQVTPRKRRVSWNALAWYIALGNNVTPRKRRVSWNKRSRRLFAKCYVTPRKRRVSWNITQASYGTVTVGHASQEACELKSLLLPLARIALVSHASQEACELKYYRWKYSANS